MFLLLACSQALRHKFPYVKKLDSARGHSLCLGPSCPLSSRGPLLCEKGVNSRNDLWWSPHHQSSGTRSGNKKEVTEPACWAARLLGGRSRDVGRKDFHFCFQAINLFGYIAYVR